jgi:hypothetical protein
MQVELNVTYEDCHIAKEAGAWFDYGGTKKWYAKNIRTALALKEYIEDGDDREMIETLVPSRLWLDVPYEEKDACKRKGGKWDKRARCWYAPNERIHNALADYAWTPAV